MNRFFIFILSAGLIIGCATSSSVKNVKQETANLRLQIETLREEQRRLAQELVKLQSMMQQSNEATGQLRAELKIELDRLARQSQLRGSRLEDADQRISKIPGKIQIVTPTSVGASDSIGMSSHSDSLLAGLKSNLAGAKTLYESAYQDLVKGQYKLAESGFRQYLQLLPEGELSDNAQYWIGECYYAQQQYREASQAFNEVITRFPRGDKVPAAMLKLGYSQYALGQRNSAIATLQDLVRNHPFSNEAKLAQSKIDELRR